MKKLWRKINLFFFMLTMENWGFPWHIIAADILSKIAYLIFTQLGYQDAQLLYLVWVAVNAIGLINEAIQHEKRKSLWQDVLANNIGILIWAL